MTRRAQAIAELHRKRPRRSFVIWSVRVLALLVFASWIVGRFELVGWFDERRRANLGRFLAELQPWPLRQGGEGETVLTWGAGLWEGGGAAAAGSTLAISVAAIVLAGAWGALLSLPAARNFAAPRPFLPGGRAPGRLSVAVWSVVVWTTRAVLVFLRALPEYVWAFLLLALLGPTAWPLVLALAIHNTGILGKLTAEVVENTDTAAPAALRGMGATRAQVVLGAVVPAGLPRFLLYFFDRWETCVREATVLGMLGMASLGYLIMDARAGNRYDEMLFFVLLGVGLVLAGDVVSAVIRRAVRRA